MKVSLVSKTSGTGVLEGKTPYEILAYVARVSNPTTQNKFEKVMGLLKYCLTHGHVSVFEQIDFTFEIQTSRAISAQILRHRHFNFQEFSQRYAVVPGIEVYEARLQDAKNRQNSLEVDDEELKTWFTELQNTHNAQSLERYQEALDKGIAKEQARFLLPMASTTLMYMKGSLRSWIHYLAVRTGPETQKENREIALEILRILGEEIPDIVELLPLYDVKKINPYD